MDGDGTLFHGTVAWRKSHFRQVASSNPVTAIMCFQIVLSADFNLPKGTKKSKIAFSFGSKVSAETSFCNFYFIIILTAHSVPPPNLLSFWLGRQKYFKASNFSTPLLPKTLRMTSLDALKLFIRTLESQSVWPDLSKFRHFGHFANFKRFN